MRPPPALRHDGAVSTVRRSRPQRGPALAAAVLLGVLAAGCVPQSSVERLDEASTVSDETRAAADRFVELLEDVDQTVAVERQVADSARATVAAVAGETLLGSQAQAFLEAHVTQVQRDTQAAAPVSAAVEVVTVAEAHDADDPVAVVTVDTVRTAQDSRATTVRAAYAVSWDVPSAAQGEAPEGLRLTTVRAVHDDDGHPAVADPTAGSSVLGVATGYVSALRSGSTHDVDAYEGGVRSSGDLRDAMRARLAVSGRSTVVEVPCGRTGPVQLVYVVLDGDVPPLRLEVDVSGPEPVVNAYL